jgi:hypothetical protein
VTVHRIKVSEKALAHLSKGLYRSPASAVRELVSNAWDAGATRVDITTSVPAFNRIVVTDNGKGFRRADFEKLMNHGIGNSPKRNPDGLMPSPGFGRPTLGRLGIGLLGVAQICSRFRIQSRTVTGESFAAELTIEDALRKRLDRDDPTLITEIPTEEGTFEEVAFGTWEFVAPTDLPDDSWTGTQILVTTPLAGFTQSFIATLRPINKDVDEQDAQMARRINFTDYPSPEETLTASPPLDWKDAVKEVAKKESVMMRGDYWRFLWELSVTCPVRYIAETALPSKIAVREQARLEGYKFQLWVDGRELRKPLWLQKRKGGYSTANFNHDLTEGLGRPLRFHGYMVVQEGKQLRPAELRGLLIRINEVGVGYYDASLLDWQTNQGPRSRWVTGEVFVDQGLEDAMNVDRDSFNKYHPDFRAIQRAVHTQLAELFKETYKKIQIRSDAKGDDRSAKRRLSLATAVGEAAGRKVNVTTKQFSGRKVGARDVANVHSERIDINLGVSESLETKKSQQELAASILAIYDTAMVAGGSSERRREIFVDALLKLLRHW